MEKTTYLDKLIRAYAPTSKSHDTHGIPDILSIYSIAFLHTHSIGSIYKKRRVQGGNR